MALCLELSAQVGGQPQMGAASCNGDATPTPELGPNGSV